MTITQAINNVDALKGNTCSQDQKVQWLSRVDSMVKCLIIDCHEGADQVNFKPYNETTDTGTELLVPEPFDEMYARYLEAQIDLVNGEMERYNNSIDLFNTLFRQYNAYYTRTHMPKGTPLRFW